MSLEKWTSGLITRLLEITHGQWLYWSYFVHDPVPGILATAWKEELLVEIEHQRELEDAGLLEEDKYLAKVSMEEMATTSGEGSIIGYWPFRPRRMLNYYKTDGSDIKQEKEKPQVSRAGVINLWHLREVREASVTSTLVCHRQILLSQAA
jgi:hypothetical protein